VLPPPARRLRAHYRVSPYLGARRQNETEMFSDHDETSPSIAAVSAPSVACSMPAVQQQKRLHRCIHFCCLVSRSGSYMRVIRSRSRSPEQKGRLCFLFVDGLLLIDKKSCYYCY